MLIPFVFLFCFFILTWYVRKTPYFSWDLALTHKLQSIKSKTLRKILDFYSWIGYPPQGIVVPLISFFTLYLVGFKRESLVGLVSSSLAFISVLIIKHLIGRKRPSIDLVSVIRPSSEMSFPSGHVTGFVNFFGYFIFLASKYLPTLPLQILSTILLSTFIILVGPSRIFRGKHWASDVLGGYLFGLSWLYFTLVFFY